MRAGHRDGARVLRHEAERLKIRHFGNSHFFRTDALDIVTPYRIAVNEEFRTSRNIALVVTDGDRNPLLREQCCRRRFFTIGTAHRSPLMCKELRKRRHPYTSNSYHVNVSRNSHMWETSDKNWSLRSYSFLNMPKEAKAGLNNMISPDAASSSAFCSASERES